MVDDYIAQAMESDRNAAYRRIAELETKLARCRDLAAELRNYFNSVEFGHRVELKLETDLYLLLNEVEEGL